MTNDSWIKIILMLIASIAVFGFIGWYTYFVWSDCLEENSVLTCMRMLSK